MKKIVTQNQPFVHFHITYDEGKKLVKLLDEKYKALLIERFESGDFKNEEKLESGKIGFSINTAKKKNNEYYAKIQEYLQEKGYYDFAEGEYLQFIDMCAGPHIENTKELDANSFKVAKLAGAYWLGDADNDQLTRISAYAFEDKETLDAHLKLLEEAKKRDHRVLGQKLGLFTFSDLVGSGLPLFTPAGAYMRNAIEDTIMGIQSKYGFEKVNIPHITKKDLYETSGHWGKYKDDLFHVTGKSDTQFVMKPMNCPHHAQIYASQSWSYRDLPIRYAETTTCYRDEQQGELLGLSRVRSLTQDDGHIFCRVDQIGEESQNLVKVIREFYGLLGMFEEGKFWVSLSVRDPKNPDKYLGDEENWEKAENFLEEVAKSENLPYKRVEGEAAFYGPKLDFQFQDAIGREWQLATIQIDFVQPERFGLEYTNNEGKKERPVMIHRAIAGSLERFMSVIIEHFAGTFPLWLSPRQAIVVPVGEKFFAYGEKILADLKKSGIRAVGDFSSDGLNKKIRNAEKMHYNYILVVGEKEENEQTVAVRNYRTKAQTDEKFDEFLRNIVEELKEKKI